MRSLVFVSCVVLGIGAVGCSVASEEVEASSEDALTSSEHRFLNKLMTDAGVPAVPPPAGTLGVGSSRTARLRFNSPIAPNPPRNGSVEAEDGTFFGPIPASKVTRAEALITAAGAPIVQPPAGLLGSSNWRSAVVTCRVILAPRSPVGCDIQPDLGTETDDDTETDDEFLYTQMERAVVPVTRPPRLGASFFLDARFFFSSPVVPNPVRHGSIDSPFGSGTFGEIDDADVLRAEAILARAGAPIRPPPAGLLGSGSWRSAIVSCTRVAGRGTPASCTITPDL